MPVTLYHNPRCSKSRETLKLLCERGIEPRIVEYLKTPPSNSELEEILAMLGMQPRELERQARGCLHRGQPG
jgi:Arsenate reductase and related proteins, glutaredoxin family